MTLVDYISQIGGLLGLFIGFSLISAIEIVYWLTFRFLRNNFTSGVSVQNNTSAEPFESPAIYVPPLKSTLSSSTTFNTELTFDTLFLFLEGFGSEIELI